jgi:Zn-dependent membrane protease YugP
MTKSSHFRFNREILRKIGFDRNLAFMCFITGIIFEASGLDVLRLAGFVALLLGAILLW